jgi:RNA polymerase sigma factor (sigma-70 family)
MMDAGVVTNTEGPEWVARPEPLTFDELYHHAYGSLVRLAALIVDDRHLAEEAVQEAFARLWSRFDRVRDPEAYVRTSVINECRSLVRRRRVSPRLRIVSETSSTTDPLDDALRTLAPKRRAVVVCRFYLGLSIEETAATLHMSTGTVKSSLHRALHDLRGALTP